MPRPSVRLASTNLAAALLALAAAACASGPPPLPAGDAIGEPLVAREPVALRAALEHPQDFEQQTLLVSGTIANVCQSKGCWMQIEDGGSTAMVRWESGCGGRYAFPKDAVGRRVLIQGSFYPKEISEADARHLESESGGKPVPRKTYEVNASGVIVLAQ